MPTENITLTRPTSLHHSSQQNNLNYTPESHLRVANASSIKKSSSFDHQAQLSAISGGNHNNNLGGQPFNIFSPEVGSHPYQSSTLSLNSAASQPFHSTGVSHLGETFNARNNEESSFILHKKQQAQAGNFTNGHSSTNGIKNELSTPTYTNEGDFEEYFIMLS